MSGLYGSNDNHAKESFNGIPPILLQTFDAYGILEPKKVNLSIPSASSEGLLIDFDSPADVNKSTEKENEGFSVIDLYQNIYVTPQLVNNKPKTETNTDIDYEEFLRKMESTMQSDNPKHSHVKQTESSSQDYSQYKDKSEPSKNINTSIFYHNKTDEYHEELIEEVLLTKTLEKLKVSISKNEETSTKARILSPPVLFKNNSEAFLLNNVSQKQPSRETRDCEYDSIWKRNGLPIVATSYTCDKNNQSTFRDTGMVNEMTHNASTSKSTNHSDQMTTSSISNSVCKDQFSLDNISISVTPLLNHTNDLNFKSQKSYIHLNSHYDDYIKLYPKSDQYQNKINTVTPKSISEINGSSPCYKNTSYQLNVPQSKDTQLNHLKQLKLCAEDTNSKVFLSDMTTLMNLTINPGEMMEVPVQAVIKDNKDYVKNRITISDAKRIHYTKGPDFNEKCIVLPHLLRNLGQEKDERDAKNNAKKRMILFSDRNSNINSQGQSSIVLEPTILMKDCNKERLKALLTRQRLTNLVQDGSLL